MPRPGFPSDQWPCERGLRAVPHQQQLCVDDCADRLRKLAMPSDRPGSRRIIPCTPRPAPLLPRRTVPLAIPRQAGRGGVRSQRHRVYADRNAHVPDADALRVVPCEQQLHAQFSGLLRMPPGGVSEHRNDRRIGAESRHGRIPDDGVGSAPRCHPITTWAAGVFNHSRDRFPADQQPRDRGLHSVPHQRQLRLDDRPDRLRKLRAAI